MRPEAVDAMLPFFRDTFGNPSGLHSVSRAAKTALEEARESVGAVVGAGPLEVVFTGGGTEADNLAVKGAARAARGQGLDGIVTTAFEHHAVLHACDRLEREGFRVTRVPVTRDGLVDVDALADAVDRRTAVVSVMLVNNEVGTVQPLDAIAEVVRERAPQAAIHSDAVQAMPWVDVAFAAAAADLVAVSAHKFGGPKGVGALVVRGVAANRLQPVTDGGGQERGLRSGTVNVAGIVGMAAAMRCLEEHRDAEVARARVLRDRLAAGILARPELGAEINGDQARRIAGNLSLYFPGTEADSLLLMLDREGVCAASGSACQSGSMEPSHVLMAMGFGVRHALSSIRLSLGWCSTDAEVDETLAVLPRVVEQLQARAATR